jgi:hypothetical protein
MNETEIELLTLFINLQATKIQRAFRSYLRRQGFYGGDSLQNLNSAQHLSSDATQL